MMQWHFVHPSPAQRHVLQQHLARLQDPWQPVQETL
jgi:hypothetical protein